MAVPVARFQYRNYQGILRTVFIRACPNVEASRLALESLLDTDVSTDDVAQA